MLRLRRPAFLDTVRSRDILSICCSRTCSSQFAMRVPTRHSMSAYPMPYQSAVEENVHWVGPCLTMG